MVRLAILFICTFNLVKLFAIQPPVNNATSLALGGTNATYINSFAIENNVAALAFNQNEIALNGQNRFGLSEYSQVGLYGNLEINNAVLGMSYSNAPLANLTIQKYSLAFAKKLMQELAVGIAINYHQHASTNTYYKKGNALTFNAGLYYQINEKLHVGFHAFNPNRSKLVDYPIERLDAAYKLGMDYQIAENITLYSDLQQSTNQELAFYTGLEIEKDQFKIRGGFNTWQELTLGLGFSKNKFSFDIGTSYHNALGISPAFNLNYAF